MNKKPLFFTILTLMLIATPLMAHATEYTAVYTITDFEYSNGEYTLNINQLPNLNGININLTGLDDLSPSKDTEITILIGRGTDDDFVQWTTSYSAISENTTLTGYAFLSGIDLLTTSINQEPFYTTQTFLNVEYLRNHNEVGGITSTIDNDSDHYEFNQSTKKGFQVTQVQIRINIDQDLTETAIQATLNANLTRAQFTQQTVDQFIPIIIVFMMLGVVLGMFKKFGK